MRRVLDGGRDRWAIPLVALATVCAAFGDTDIRHLQKVLPDVTLGSALALVVLTLLLSAGSSFCICSAWTVHVEQPVASVDSVIVALTAGVGLVTTSGGFELARASPAVRRQSAITPTAFFARMVSPSSVEKVAPSLSKRQDEPAFHPPPPAPNIRADSSSSRSRRGSVRIIPSSPRSAAGSPSLRPRLTPALRSSAARSTG